ncbi:hypothetical protein D9M69_510360 [compost metagenome]
MSAKETRATAQPPRITEPRSTGVIQGTTNDGRPWGSEPRTLTPAPPPRSSRPTARVAATTAIRMPGRRGKRLSRRIATSVPPPTAKVVQLASPAFRAATRLRISRNGPSLLTEISNNLGNWLISTVSAIPFR